MKHAHIIRILAVATVCIVTAQDIPQGDRLTPETETERRIRLAGQSNDRSEMPFLEGTALSEDTERLDRKDAARTYLKLATAEECATFLPKILAVDDENKKIISWRYDVTPVCLSKIEEAIAANELPEETVTGLVTSFVMYTPTAYYTAEAVQIDGFLVKHCEGYESSWQRLAMWTRILDADKENEIKWERCLPLKQSVEVIPPSKRVDLRNRFPDLPPLPEDPKDKTTPYPYLWPAAGIIALVALILALILRKAKK